MPDPDLFDATTLQQYLRDGYVRVQTCMPAGFHEELYRKIDEVVEKEGNPGNNLVPRIPAISQVLADPGVEAALTGILGPGYLAHAHRHCHYRQPHTEAQRLHKDSWSRLHHRARWAMAFYYPQDTTVDMGPTGVVPGSQYLNRDPQVEPTALEGGAGTVVIVHYDLWHLGMANTSDRKRYMLKFLFSRTDEPVQQQTLGDASGNGDGLSPLHHSLWRWYHGMGEPAGGRDLSSKEIAELGRQLSSEQETEGLQAAYTLGESGSSAAASTLLDALHTDSVELRRTAGYGLSALGPVAVPDLVQLVDGTDSEDQRTAALEALADMGTPAAEAVPTLRRALSSPGDSEFRRCAAYALGNLGTAAADALPELAAALSGDDDEVARDAAHTLARIGRGARPALEDITAALDHPNRYVQASCLRALQRMDCDEARQTLLDHLTTARWCPLTTKDTLY
ncbi:MAG: HEAT repeat domain-containing protein [Candidatus Latescibacterota bacterium]|nr:HEAT repeat domain-containing protein [Candidatus Latescibacterota bacterium]